MDFLGDANVFQGRVSRGRVRFASVELDAPEHADVGSLPARVFVRPHDLDVDVVPSRHPSLKAAVVGVHSAGPVVRLDLRS